MERLKEIDTMQKCFLSYPSSHVTHATFFRKILEELYPENIEIFLAADCSSIGPGDDWYASIISNLKDINYFLVLLPSFKVSPWVMFEAGAAVIQDVKVIPLRYYGLNVDFVPSPLMPKQSTDLTKGKEVKEVLKKLALNKLPDAERLNEYTKKVTQYFSRLVIEGSDLSVEGRMVPSLFDRLQSLSIASDTQRKIFFYILKNSEDEGLLESTIRKKVPVMYHHYGKASKTSRKRQIICPSEYYFRLRELFHLGFLEMEKESEFENRWIVRPDIKESLATINPSLVKRKSNTRRNRINLETDLESV